MSIVDQDKIDAAGVAENGKVLKLMISDHLSWEYEDLHLEILQDKINLYLQYINSKQYVSKYGDEFTRIDIDIHFKEKVTEKCVAFLDIISQTLSEEQIQINMVFE